MLQRYESPSQFWSEVGTSKNEWYKGAVEYWDNQSNTDDGVLGGLACLSEKDVRDSLVFIKKVRHGVHFDHLELLRHLCSMHFGWRYLTRG